MSVTAELSPIIFRGDIVKLWEWKHIFDKSPNFASLNSLPLISYFTHTGIS